MIPRRLTVSLGFVHLQQLPLSLQIFLSKLELGEMGSQQIMISDDQDYKREKSDDGFVVMNIEDLLESNSTIKETSNPISRIITRSFSRKVSQREEVKKGADFLVGDDDEHGVGVTEESLKELAAALIGSCTDEKSDFVVNIEQSSSAQQQQQKNMTKSISHQESNKFMRRMRRRSSYNSNNQFGSSIRAWIDPSRILFFFATLSSMGTIILIYFTLSIARLSGDGSAHAQ